MPTDAISISPRSNRPKMRTCQPPPGELPDMAFSLTWLPEVLEEPVSRWRNSRAGERADAATMGTVRGVMCHHTAGPKDGNMPSLGIVTNGRPDLAGPLSQLCLGRDGTFFVVAAGRASHAGEGTGKALPAAIRVSSELRPRTPALRTTIPGRTCRWMPMRAGSRRSSRTSGRSRSWRPGISNLPPTR